MKKVVCDGSGNVAIADILESLNKKIESVPNSTDKVVGGIKTRLDKRDPKNIKLYMTNNGTNP